MAGFLVGERIKYGVTSTGASSDFYNALGVAQAMVWEYMEWERAESSEIMRSPRTARRSILSFPKAFKKQLNDETQAILRQCEQ